MVDNAVFIDVASEVTICNDAKDNFLLELALDGMADYLVTGDNDLLVLEAFGSAKILTLAQFLQIMQSDKLSLIS